METAVGKSSLIRRYIVDEFEDWYITTLGAHVSKKDLVFPANDGNPEVRMDMTIWDIMGRRGSGTS